ncbi:MAG: hypothetical protein GY862_04750 [Gammaproteobacteria bacterium]|nr:hypothetical protein [Gammaproteobacteria bacterium]
MSLTNPLPPIWDTFKVADQAIRLARKMTVSPRLSRNAKCQGEVAAYRRRLLKNTGTGSIDTWIFDRAIEENKDLFILALWAAFERFLRTYLQDKGRVLQLHVAPGLLRNAFYDHFHKEVEYWKPNEMLDLLKRSLKNKIERISEAKDAVKYRDWVAHGKNRAKQPPSNVVPKTAYRALDDIINELIRLDKQP